MSSYDDWRSTDPLDLDPRAGADNRPLYTCRDCGVSGSEGFCSASIAESGVSRSYTYCRSCALRRDRIDPGNGRWDARSLEQLTQEVA